MPISWANERLGDRYLLLVSIVFTGLAVTGKGFAYLLPAPFFVSEVVMALGVYVVLRAGSIRSLFTLPQPWVMVAMFAWGAYRTLPYIPKYNIDAVRDAMLFGYMTWAFVLGGLIVAKPERLNMIIKWFPKFVVIFLIACPIGLITYKFAGKSLPGYPWAPDISFVSIKAGDTCVILGMIMAFWVTGFMTNIRIIYLALLMMLLAFCGSINRGGLLSFMTAMFLCMFCKPRSPWPWRVLGTLFVAMSLLFVTNVEIEVPGTPRTISFDQVIENVLSIAGLSENKNLGDTKEWRMAWWDTIFSYTLHGPYKWTGKGFGINLADDDGFQVSIGEAELRSPHNAHMNILARSGVPGITLWVGVLALWALQMGYCFLLSYHRRDGQWPNVFMWLGATFAACCLNASVDVYLEGPMGGVPMWTVYGVGLASMYLYKNKPHILRHPAEPIPLYADASYDRYAPPRASGPTRFFGPAPVARPAGKPAQFAPFEDQSRN